MFWNIKHTLSYRALFNYIIGNRGGGKTFGAKQYVIEQFLKNQKEFIYLRRYRTELQKIDTFFKDIEKFFPNHEFKVKNKNFYIDDEYCGRAIQLSTAQKEKSTAFPNVSTIIFDEFIIDKGTIHYLPQEVICFLEFYETVARSRDDCIVFFLGNAITTNNPYFNYFNLKLPYGKNIKCENDILIELVSDDEFIKDKKQTRFGKLISGTKYGDYSIENKFLQDNKVFIKKKTGDCKFFFKFLYKDLIYGVWINIKEGLLYVSYDYDKNRPYTYVLTKEDHTPNTLLLPSIKKSNNFKIFLTNYELGNVRAENQKIQNVVDDIIKMARIK